MIAKHLTSTPRRQQGIVLVVAMVMLVVMSILGISSVRGIALEEKMTANAFDRSLAFQAAEAALRAGEQDVTNRVAIPHGTPPDLSANTPCAPVAVNGYVAIANINCGPDWMREVNWQAPNQSRMLNKATTNLGALAGNEPRYIIEYMGDNFNCNPGLNPDGTYGSCKLRPQDCVCHRYRVTAMSNPGDDRANVMLQSMFYTR